MAKILQGILGPFSGKVGNVIGYERNGVFCMRSMPRFYHDKRSAAQLKNRNRFSMVMKVMSAVKGATRLGFGRFADGMTEMNVATRVNYYSLVEEGGSGLVYSFGGLTMSRGPVEVLEGVMMSVAGGVLALVWNGAALMGGGEDLVGVVVVNARRMEMRMWRGVARRGEGRVTVGLPSGWGAEETHCYVMMERDGEWSESQYIGNVNDEDTIAVLEMGKVNLEGSEDEVLQKTDQSAIKVLSNSGLSREKMGEELPPGGEN